MPTGAAKNTQNMAWGKSTQNTPIHGRQRTKRRSLRSIIHAHAATPMAGSTQLPIDQASSQPVSYTHLTLPTKA